MNQPAPPQHPGWAWDAAANRWVPTAPPPGQAPQQSWQPAGPQQPLLPGPGFGAHLRRAISWNVREIVVSPREHAQLVGAGVVEPRMQALLAWRRSTLLVVLPIVLLSLGLSVADAAGTETDSFTGLGKLWVWLPPLGLAFVPIGALAVLSKWTRLRNPSRTLIRCWALSLVIPLVAALLPLDAILDVEGLKQQITTSDQLLEFRSAIFAGRVQMAVGYALSLLPVIISVPSGVLKGAGRVKSLFPAASLPGWFLVAVAPFYSLFMIVVFVLIDQIVGNWLLLFGVGLLAFSPWLFVLHRRVYARPLAIDEARAALPKAAKPGAYVTLAGAVVVIGYLLTAQVEGMDVIGSDENTAVFTYLQVGRTAVEVIGRSLVTAVVFCMIFLTMMFAEWRTAHELSAQVRGEHEEQMQELRRYAEA